MLSFMQSFHVLCLVRLDLFLTYRKIKSLTEELDVLRKAVKESSTVELNADETMVKRTEPLLRGQSYQNKAARMVVAYNLPSNSNADHLQHMFSSCGNTITIQVVTEADSKNVMFEPPIHCSGTYALVEFEHEVMARHAVLTLSDQNDWRNGLQVVLLDGTTSEKLRQKMFPPTMVDRKRAVSVADSPLRPMHVEAVGEGLDGLTEGKIEKGTIYSIRGAGGLINPTKYPTACISFRLIPADNADGLQQGDSITFMVGKNKKSGRKYASRVTLLAGNGLLRRSSSSASDIGNGLLRRSCSSASDIGNGLLRRSSSSVSDIGNGLLRRSSSCASDSGLPVPPVERKYFTGNSTRWLSRRRSSVLGGSLPQVQERGESLGLGGPKLTRQGSLDGTKAVPFKQAKGPDGTTGFSHGRGKENVEGRVRALSNLSNRSPSPAPVPESRKVFVA